MKKTMAMCGAAVAAAVAFAGETNVLERFYGENVGKSLRRIPSWVVPENAFLSLSNTDFDEPDMRTQKRIFAEYVEKSDWNVLTYTLRCVPDLSSKEVQWRVAEASRIMKEAGIELLMDVDPRIMRNEFLERWPDDCLHLRQFGMFEADGAGTAKFRIEQPFMRDHMCYGTEPYSWWKPGRVVSARAALGGDVSRMRTVDVVDVEAATNFVSGVVNGLASGERLLVEVDFPLKEADPYSPHLMPFTREMTLRYRKLGVAGAMRDEWGFQTPRTEMREHRAFWYSKPFAAAYAKNSGKRCLEEDYPMLAFGAPSPEKTKAVRAYMRTIFDRCRRTEEDFYDSDKEYFGPDVYVAKHPTWYTSFGAAEFLHNGLDWWAAKRDWAQSDESNYVPASLGMCKKFGTPLWLNEGYGPNPMHYVAALWRYMLCGGRMVYHGIYGGGGESSLSGISDLAERKFHAQADLLSQAGIRAEEISRLLPLMTRAPVNSHVAHIFGHARLTDWTDESYTDWGEPIAHGLGAHGYYADAYPSSELFAGTFSVDADGYLRVGGQRYAACVLYHLDARDRVRWNTLTKKRKLATRVFVDPALEDVVGFLDKEGAERQPPLLHSSIRPSFANRLPGHDGTLHLVDGTVARIKGCLPDPAGDVIDGVLTAGGVDVRYSARGLFAVRVENGEPTGIAAGELRSVSMPGFTLELPNPEDVALTKIGGIWHGTWQTADTGASVPAALAALTAKWVKLRGVTPPAPERSAYAVVCDGESGPEKRAAAELKHWISEIAMTPPNVEFRIGVKHADLFPDDKNFLEGSDGFAVRRRNGTIYIFGAHPRGVLYGVYAFLERNSDIIWARPDETCGVMFTRKQRFEAKDADFRERPQFQMRGWWICGRQYDPPTEYWNARMRCNFGCASRSKPGVRERSRECGFLVAGGSGHNMPGFIPDSAYDTHPEYFALVSGVRRRDKGKTQFCFSNLDGAKLVGETAVKKITEVLKTEPFDTYAIKQADNQRLCECADCAAPIVLPDGRTLTKGAPNFVSTRFFIYLNRAVDEVVRAYPKMRVDTFGYQFTAPAPEVAVHPSVNIAFCPFVKNDRFSCLAPVNAKWKERAEAWAKATPNVMWREYWGCATAYPRPLSIVAAEDLKWIRKDLGFTRVYSETVPDMDSAKRKSRRRWDASAMEQWVLSRLMWDPFRPVQDYRDEYIRRTYRRAAEPMREFYAKIAETWYADTVMSNYRDDEYGSAARYMVRPGISGKLLELLDEAERLAAGDIPATRAILRRQKAHFADLIANAGKLEEPLVIPCVQGADWSRAQVIKSFQRVTGKRTDSRVRANRDTRVEIMHDTKRLYVRFNCSEPHPQKIEALERVEGAKEFFPKGDHIEFVLSPNGTDCYHYAVDVNGNATDRRNADPDWNGRWTPRAERTKKGYTITLEIEMEPLGIELTKNNRFTACFARMSPHGGLNDHSEFSSWRGVHPQAQTAFGDIFLNME